ncbi:hypothetical protein CY34DRAFT_471189 [Suillus luteus UH-Slu-Lm8-n1]|uniref:Uncharacterized protein n=1 Tax=Suillus luteus UH-Slu-Lm8-n1 TaxID=930992 RepID=A0A0C9ZIH0_9AGAM|nr:hypothetical protein CY34DRAFT_471189 [Suillus luteus UH-Slu-Lm8-n1]
MVRLLSRIVSHLHNRWTCLSSLFLPFDFNLQALPCRAHTIPMLHGAVNNLSCPRHILSSWSTVRYLFPSSIR